ncbi:MAG: sigma-70 family RNA polymerase sigma factor [Bacteroidales bacterium]|nr:sigma-70 family RNA polymerase sigma factor [Bacteroidales bacterium]
MPENYKLIRRCQKKSKKAFDELYRKYSGLVFGICLRYTKNRVEAEDLLHDCFLKIIENIEAFQFSGSSEGWVKRIAVNTAINKYRSKRRDIELEDDESQFDDANTKVESQIEKLQLEELLNIINSISEGYRIIFNMYVIEGYQHKEIADILGISENTSKTQYRKARLAIIEKLKSLNEENER